jgi:hypothetical protein
MLEDLHGNDEQLILEAERIETYIQNLQDSVDDNNDHEKKNENQKRMFLLL